MVDQRVDELHAAVTDRFDAALRSVAAYDEDGLDIRSMRDDVASLYDEEDHGRVFRTLRLEAMDRPTQESLFAHDDLQCTYRVFDGATEIHVATSQTTGVLVSLDDDADVDLRATTDLLLDVLGPVADEGEPDTPDNSSAGAE